MRKMNQMRRMILKKNPMMLNQNHRRPSNKNLTHNKMAKSKSKTASKMARKKSNPNHKRIRVLEMESSRSFKAV